MVNTGLFAKYAQYENSKEVGIAIRNIVAKIGRLQDQHSDLVDLMEMMVALENMGKRRELAIGSVGGSWTPYQFDGMIQLPLTSCNNEFSSGVELKIMKSRPGFRITYEILEDGVLKSHHFPTIQYPPIYKEEEAWRKAKEFSEMAHDNVFNIYVVDDRFSPVAGHEEKKLRPR